MGRLAVQVIAMVCAMACLIWLIFTDLDNVQRFLLSGVTCFTAIATWDRK